MMMQAKLRMMERLLRLDNLWWWLALLSIVSLLGHEIARSSSFALVLAAEFEGFGDESEEEDEELNVVLPTPTPTPRRFDSEDPPPAQLHDKQEETEQKDISDALSVEEAPSATEQRKRSIHQDYWDEDEFEGLPEVSKQQDSSSSEAGQASGDDPASKVSPLPAGPQSYYIEASCIIFLVAFAFTFLVGRKENETIALKWAAQYACKDEIFDRNFSLLGTGGVDSFDAPLLVKEGQTIFKFYASGRRYCQGLLATMDLQGRHDLVARLWYLISPKRDEITIDVYMNDENMEPITFALVRKKATKAMQKEWRDLQLFASILSMQPQRRWLSEELAVFSESRELATDLLTDTVVDQVFSEKAFEKYGRYFLSLHFTDQFPYGSHKKVLQFRFLLPLANRMEDMKRLIGLVPYYIDLIGRYKLSAQCRSKAETARVKVVEMLFKEAQNARQDALQKKKEDRKKALEETDSKNTVEALRKKEEKERQRQIKKSMPRIKMTRVH